MAGLFKLFKKKDRRRFNRFIVTEVTPVFFEPYVPVIANVIDISLGGLKIRYSEGNKKPEEVFDLDLQASDGFRLGSARVQKISDNAAKRRDKDNQNARILRGRFLKLSDVQRLRLEAFLESYQEKFDREA